MTIKRGEDWGATVPRPADGRTAESDAEVARLVAADDDRPVIVTGGDLHRTIGSPRPTDTALRLPIDVIEVEADGSTFTAVAHVVLRRPGRLGWWRGPLVAAMNAEFIGDWDVATRAHPNDGRFDVVVVDESLGVRERWQARRRLPTGAHVPHPAITITQRTEASFTFARPVAVFVDGVRRATTTAVTVRIQPDAAVVHA